MHHKISVIIPVYNVYQYLSDCLDSVFSQDIDNSSYEIIVVDDCSPFGEKAIVDTYIKKHPNIKYIRHDINKRQGGARNTGLRIADGEYIMFIDADDFLIQKNVFSVLLHLVNKYNSIVLRSESYQSFSSETHFDKLEKTFINSDEIKYSVCDFKKWRSGHISCSACSTLYKRTFLLENNLFFRENVLYEDTDWVQKTMFYARNIDFVDIPFYGYRQSANSTTRGYSLASFEGNADGVIESFIFIKELELEKSFQEHINEQFIKNVLGILKMSRKFSIKDSCRVLNKLKKAEITSLRSKSFIKNIILCFIHITPVIPVTLINISYKIKHCFS